MAIWTKKPLQINGTPSKGLLGRFFDTLKLHHDWINGIKEGKGIYFNYTADGGIEICSTGAGGSGLETEDFAFKISVRVLPDSNPPVYYVHILGGSATSYGGKSKIFFDTIPWETSFLYNDGEYIWLEYYAYRQDDFSEIGTWSDILHSQFPPSESDSPATMYIYLGRVGEAYTNKVSQWHKGAIVMPAISNIVDIQTQPPPTP